MSEFKPSRIKKAIGIRLRNLRKIKGLTQAELAEQVNISSTHIGLIERGEKGASYELLEKLAHVFKVQIKDIFTGYLAVQDRLHDSIEEEYLDSIIFLLTKFDTKRLLFIKEFLENYQKTFEKN